MQRCMIDGRHLQPSDRNRNQNQNKKKANDFQEALPSGPPSSWTHAPRFGTRSFQHLARVLVVGTTSNPNQTPKKKIRPSDQPDKNLCRVTPVLR